ncbi:MAG TPA: GNAT family N-acetyltransferase, partial [Candidatus Dormibacteraeota bacterium]|nr:GNAT family N-acetyltransferase [Candidatus Dormibacteraeota bacterium]
YAAFEGETSRADLAIAGYSPEGFWVAEEDGRIVGYAYGYFKDAPDSVLRKYGATRVAYLASMAVDPRYRGKGIASSLLARLLDEFQKAGADLVLVDCPAEATSAKSIYDKLGFQVRGYNLMLKLAKNRSAEVRRSRLSSQKL